MKRIEKDELFQNVKEFLKTKGIELSDGSYSQGIHKTCSLLADVINLSQQGLERAKDGVDRKLDQVRQVIHEKTAPKPPRTSPSPDPSPGPPPTDQSEPEAPPPPVAPEPKPQVKRKTPRRPPAVSKKPAARTPRKSPRRPKSI